MPPQFHCSQDKQTRKFLPAALSATGLVNHGSPEPCQEANSESTTAHGLPAPVCLPSSSWMKYDPELIYLLLTVVIICKVLPLTGYSFAMPTERKERSVALNHCGQQNEDIKTLYKFGKIDKGKGAQGEVFVAQSYEEETIHAIKVITGADEQTLERIQLEVEAMQTLDHENIMKVDKVIRTDLDNRTYLVMDWLGGGRLCDRISVEEHVFKPKDVAIITSQLASALKHAHEKGFVHHDIKPENVMFLNEKKKVDGKKDLTVKLIDWGLALKMIPGKKFLSSTKSQGTLAYMAPELVNPSFFKLHYDQSIDLWSLGCIIYYMLEGRPPFHLSQKQLTKLKIHGGSPQQKVIDNIKKGNVPWSSTVWKEHPNAKGLVQRLLKKDPKARMSAADVLNHPFITG